MLSSCSAHFIILIKCRERFNSELWSRDVFNSQCHSGMTNFRGDFGPYVLRKNTYPLPIMSSPNLRFLLLSDFLDSGWLPLNSHNTPGHPSLANL